LIRALAFGPQGNTLVVLYRDGRILDIDLAQDVTRCQLNVNRDIIGPWTSLVMVPDGTTLLTGREDGLIQRWDLQRCAAASRFAMHPAGVHAMAMSPDGRSLAVGDARSRAYLYPFLAGGDSAAALLGQVCTRDDSNEGGRIRALAFRPDGSALAAGAEPCAADDRRTLAVFRLPGAVRSRPTTP